jgi:hypothetical protein
MRVRRGGDSGIAVSVASVYLPLERSSGRKYSENLDFGPGPTALVENKTPDQRVTRKFVTRRINGVLLAHQRISVR